MYTAAVLTDHSRSVLLARFAEVYPAEARGFQFSTVAGEPLPHHLTINMGGIDLDLNPKLTAGLKVLIPIYGFCIDEELNVCAARCDLPFNPEGDRFFSINAQPHVTMCIRLPKGKPFLSNKLDWKAPAWTCNATKGTFEFDDLLMLSARIEECQ